MIGLFHLLYNTGALRYGTALGIFALGTKYASNSYNRNNEKPFFIQMGIAGVAATAVASSTISSYIYEFVTTSSLTHMAIDKVKGVVQTFKNQPTLVIYPAINYFIATRKFNAFENNRQGVKILAKYNKLVGSNRFTEFEERANYFDGFKRDDISGSAYIAFKDTARLLNLISNDLTLSNIIEQTAINFGGMTKDQFDQNQALQSLLTGVNFILPTVFGLTGFSPSSLMMSRFASSMSYLPLGAALSNIFASNVLKCVIFGAAFWGISYVANATLALLTTNDNTLYTHINQSAINYNSTIQIPQGLDKEDKAKALEAKNMIVKTLTEYSLLGDVNNTVDLKDAVYMELREKGLEHATITTQFFPPNFFQHVNEANMNKALQKKAEYIAACNSPITQLSGAKPNPKYTNKLSDQTLEFLNDMQLLRESEIYKKIETAVEAKLPKPEQQKGK